VGLKAVTLGTLVCFVGVFTGFDAAQAAQVEKQQEKGLAPAPFPRPLTGVEMGQIRGADTGVGPAPAWAGNENLWAAGCGSCGGVGGSPGTDGATDDGNAYFSGTLIGETGKLGN